jgi:hypothetical protein
MKKLLILLLFPLSLFAQVKYSSGVYKTMPWGYWDNPETENLVVVLQGSGEYVSDLNGVYSPTGVLSKNSYARNAMVKTYPFDILVAGSYKRPGASGNPSQAGITQYLSEFIKTLDHDKVILTGYSYGGQAAAGFRTNSCNSGKPTHYLGSEVFDAYIIMCGKAPGSQDWQANKDKPVMVVHGSADTAVPISNGTNIMNKHNGAIPAYRIYPDNKLTYSGGSSGWVKQDIPDSVVTRMVVIVGGGHSSSWNYGYQWFDPGSENNDVRKFVEWVFKEDYKPIECTAVLNEREMWADFTLPDGTVKRYKLLP